MSDNDSKKLAERTMNTVRDLNDPRTLAAIGIMPKLKPGEYPADTKAEKTLQGLEETKLTKMGIAFLHLSPKSREKKGWPDLVFSVDGIPIAIENKVGNKKLSPEQRMMLTMMLGNGWRVYVVRHYGTFCRILHSPKSVCVWDEN